MDPLRQIVNQFEVPPGKIDIEPLGTGNINQSFVVEVTGEDASKRFVLQEINKLVFKEPMIAMENLEKVYDCFGRQRPFRLGL